MATGGFDMDVRADVKKVEKMLTASQRKVIPQATARTLNRTASTVRTQARREVARQMGVKQKAIKNQLDIIVKAKRTRLFTQIEATGYALNLIEFVAPSKREPGAFRKKKGVTAKAYGQKKEYKGSFIVKGKGSGKPVVVGRRPDAERAKGKWQSPWSKSFYGPSVPKTFIQDKIVMILRKVANVRWRKEFDNNVRYYLRKAGYKVR